MRIVLRRIVVLMAGVLTASCGTPQPLPSVIDAGPPRIPCAVEAVLRARCQGCHGSPPTQNAPFPLLTQADFLAPYQTNKVVELVFYSIESDFMPLNGPPLSAPDKAVVLEWLDAGVPLVTEICP